MTPEDSDRRSVAEAVVATRRRPSIVWLVPLVAALVGGFVAWRTFSERGPEIEIEFKNADGLEAGKTKIKYKDVEVGLVQSITLRPDLSGVVCTARMVKGADEYLREKTRFWVVTARLAGAQVSGLGTLLSGAYIGLDPALEGRKMRHFRGLDEAPVVTAEQSGRYFVLHSREAGSIQVASPVYFRRIDVGEVASSELDPSGDFVTVRVFVHAPYDDLVKQETRFWKVSGIHASMTAAGAEVDVESVEALLVGGIAFETPRAAEKASAAPEDAVFDLYPNLAATEKPVYTEKRYFVLYFDQSIRGLEVGAPVEFRGIQVGEVSDVKIVFDPATQQFRIPVVIAIEPERFGLFAQVDPAERRAAIERVVKRGMRAQLQSGSLLTGKLLVAFDFHEDAPPAEVVWSEPYPQLPTIPTPLEELTSSVTRLAAELEKVPYDRIAKSLDQTLEATRTTLAAAERTLQSANALVAPESSTTVELQRALVQLGDAARSIGLAADQIERQPDSLLFGRKGKQ
jgi:paraquat-inducible protein B